MLYRILLVVIILFSGLRSFALELSEKAEIRVVTFSPEQRELYSAFGHNGFRILDSANRIDAFFNYGIFDFNQPNFYLNFSFGKLIYQLGAIDYGIIKASCIRNNRSITEQILNLSKEEKQAVFNFLIENNKPENREYYYNYIYNNCATKIRDVLQEVLNGKIIFDYSYVKEDLSYRDLMDLYLEYQPWGDLGIDLCLSSEIDIIADGNGYMYLPDYIEIAFDMAKISNNGIEKDLVSNKEKVFISIPQDYKNSFFSPLLVFVGIFFIIGFVTHRSLKYNTSNRWLDVVLFGITGITGILLLFLWMFTDHLSTYNWNIFWAMPINLIVLYYLLKNKKINFIKFYFLIYGIIQLFLIAFRDFLIQSLHIAFVPLVLGLAIRSLYLYFDLKKKEL